MRFTPFAIFGALAAGAAALPASVPYTVHERRGASSWFENTDVKPNGRINLPVRIGLTQNNLDRGHDLLMEVADPSSDKYGKHYTQKEVTQYPRFWLYIQRICILN